VNFFRIAALSVLLAASVAGAQTKKQKEEAERAKANVPKPIITEKDRPKTCTDQCALMKKMIVDNCKKGAGENKAAQKSCEDTVNNMVSACEGSCNEKGRLDKQYIMERLRPPGGVKVPQGGQQQGAGGEEDHGDAH
jgi:hypothetical protein